MLLDGDDAGRSLGGALAWFLRRDAAHLNVVVRDEAAAGLLARRVGHTALQVDLWQTGGNGLERAEPSPPPEVGLAVDPEAELFVPVLREAGLEPVVEAGILRGEYLGLEVARVVSAEETTADAQRLELRVGVGRFDQEASALVNQHRPALDVLNDARALVAEHRRHDAALHPANQLVPERWLRSVLVSNAALVGVERLSPADPVPARANLRERGVAPMVGTDRSGNAVMVVASCGVDLDLVPAAADARAAHDPGARLLLAVPERDAHEITRQLAARLVVPAEVVTVPDEWREIASVQPVESAWDGTS